MLISRRRSFDTAVSVAALFGLAVFSAASLHAYVLLGFAWSGGEVEYRLNPNFPDVARAGDTAGQIEILQCGAKAWRDQTRADWRFLYGGTTSRSGIDLGDGVNAVSWVDANDATALAVTVIGRGPRNQRAFDIVFYGQTGGRVNHWVGGREPQSGEIDILGVGVHEFGHALGLDHTNVAGATMYPSVFDRGRALRTLEVDDRAGVETLYGLRTNETPRPELLALSPANGSTLGGYEVVLEGVNFTFESESELSIGGFAVSKSRWNVETCERIRILDMPPHPAGIVTVDLSNSLGAASSTVEFTYVPLTPTLTSIDPALGPLSGGIDVTVSGENFSPLAQVTIGEALLEDAQVLDTRTIRGTLPPSAGAATVDVRVEQDGETAVLVQAFTYSPYFLRLSDAVTAPGARGVVLEALVSSPDDLEALSFGLRYDPAALQLDDLTAEGTAAAGAELVTVEIDNASGSASYDLLLTSDPSGTVLPQGDDVVCARAEWSVPEDALADRSTRVSFVDDPSEPPVPLSVRPLGGVDSAPSVVDGLVVILDAAVFVRGDTNGDEILELTDALIILNWLFLRGPSPVPCADTADLNDDGFPDVSDVVYALFYLFGDGPSPHAPFPLPGPDPTDDDPLDC